MTTKTTKSSKHFYATPLSGAIHHLHKSTPLSTSTRFSSFMKFEGRPGASSLHKTFSFFARTLHNSILGDLTRQAIAVLSNPGAHFLSRKQLKNHLYHHASDEIRSTPRLSNPYEQPKIKSKNKR